MITISEMRTQANIGGADLTGTDLSYANLAGASLNDSDVTEADLSGAILFNATSRATTSGSAFFDANTDFTNAWANEQGGTLFDPLAAGWTLVPEPGTALLLSLGLVALSARRREVLGRGVTSTLLSRLARVHRNPPGLLL